MPYQVRCIMALLQWCAILGYLKVIGCKGPNSLMWPEEENADPERCYSLG